MSTETTTPAKSHKGRRFLGWSITVVASFILGANLGGDAPADAETVTKTVEVTPDVCVTAINRGDDVIALAGEGFGASAEAMQAAAAFDIAGIEAATDTLVGLNDQVEAIDYRTAADECLAGAR